MISFIMRIFQTRQERRILKNPIVQKAFAESEQDMNEFFSKNINNSLSNLMSDLNSKDIATDTPRALTTLDFACPQPLCHAKPGEPCYKKTGRPMHGFHEERIAREAVNKGTFNIAYCPEHGLHGGREECWVCRRPVEQIPMRPVSDWCPVEIPND